MSEATLTSKGQITIPIDIRKSMSIGPKDRLTFTPMSDGTVVMRAKTKSIKDLRGMSKIANSYKKFSQIGCASTTPFVHFFRYVSDETFVVIGGVEHCSIIKQIYANEQGTIVLQ